MKRQSIADDSEPIVECSRQAAPSIQPAQDNCSNGSTQHQEQEKREIAGEDQEDLGYTHTLVRYKKGKTTGYKNQQHLYPNYGKKKRIYNKLVMVKKKSFINSGNEKIKTRKLKCQSQLEILIRTKTIF